MAALSDQIDRLSRCTKSIRSIAARIGTSSSGSHPEAGPFTRSVLNTALGDLIRDVDPSELGLFSLVVSSGAGASQRDTRGPSNPEITRVEFPGPTPLRKQTGRREDLQKPKELEPEVYAQAALKYLDRYEPIRPMPRANSQVASIMEQVSSVRDSMRTLNETLEQTESADAPLSLKDQADEEERRIKDLQSRIAELKERKEAVLKVKKGKLPLHRQSASRKISNVQSLTPVSSSTNEDHEDAFWTTPAEAARTLRFDNLLNDDLADLGDISMSFASPIPPVRTRSSGLSEGNVRQGSQEPDVISPDRSPELPDDYEDDDDDEGEDEMTVVLKKQSVPSAEPPSPSPSSSSSVDEPEPPTPARLSSSTDTPSRSKRFRVKVNGEVERIVLKMWATVGEIIMPGNPFTTPGNKPPRATETISHLQAVSAYTPVPISPSATSESSLLAGPKEPTSQQILTAHLLLALLSSRPHFSMPLNKVKEELVSKAGGTAAALTVGTTRILYGCVAKRLVKIDRGGGEQVVKFDV